MSRLLCIPSGNDSSRPAKSTFACGECQRNTRPKPCEIKAFFTPHDRMQRLGEVGGCSTARLENAQRISKVPDSRFDLLGLIFSRDPGWGGRSLADSPESFRQDALGLEIFE